MSFDEWIAAKDRLEEWTAAKDRLDKWVAASDSPEKWITKKDFLDEEHEYSLPILEHGRETKFTALWCQADVWEIDQIQHIIRVHDKERERFEKKRQEEWLVFDEKRLKEREAFEEKQEEARKRFKEKPKQVREKFQEERGRLVERLQFKKTAVRQRLRDISDADLDTLLEPSNDDPDEVGYRLWTIFDAAHVSLDNADDAGLFARFLPAVRKLSQHSESGCAAAFYCLANVLKNLGLEPDQLDSYRAFYEDISSSDKIGNLLLEVLLVSNEQRRFASLEHPEKHHKLAQITYEMLRNVSCHQAVVPLAEGKCHLHRAGHLAHIMACTIVAETVESILLRSLPAEIVEDIVSLAVGRRFSISGDIRRCDINSVFGPWPAVKACSRESCRDPQCNRAFVWWSEEKLMLLHHHQHKDFRSSPGFCEKEIQDCLGYDKDGDYITNEISTAADT